MIAQPRCRAAAPSHDDDDHRHRDGGEHDGRALRERERRTAVAADGEQQGAAEQPDRVAVLEVRDDEVLGQRIEREDGDGRRREQPGGAPRGTASAALLALLACRRTGSHAGTPAGAPSDRVAAVLAAPVGAGVEPRQRALDLREQVAAVVGQRHLVLALERLGAGVGLVAGALAAGVTLQRRLHLLRLVDLAAQVLGLLLELLADLVELRPGPRLLDRDGGRSSPAAWAARPSSAVRRNAAWDDRLGGLGRCLGRLAAGAFAAPTGRSGGAGVAVGAAATFVGAAVVPGPAPEVLLGALASPCGLAGGVARGFGEAATGAALGAVRRGLVDRRGWPGRDLALLAGALTAFFAGGLGAAFFTTRLLDGAFLRPPSSRAP